MNSQMIQMSRNGRQDAAFGEGVYLTSLPPNGSYTQVVTQNNKMGRTNTTWRRQSSAWALQFQRGKWKTAPKWVLEAKDLYFKEYLPLWIGEYVEEQDACTKCMISFGLPCVLGPVELFMEYNAWISCNWFEINMFTYWDRVRYQLKLSQHYVHMHACIDLSRSKRFLQMLPNSWVITPVSIKSYKILM